MPQIIAQVQQTNGPQSFRPPLEALPENYFRGFCYEILCEFFEESQINFQIHQQSCLDEIELQKSLLGQNKFCDSQVYSNVIADFQIEEDYLKEPNRSIKKQKSMIEEISEDKSILHPKKQMMDPQKFVK